MTLTVKLSPNAIFIGFSFDLFASHLKTFLSPKAPLYISTRYNFIFHVKSNENSVQVTDFYGFYFVLLLPHPCALLMDCLECLSSGFTFYIHKRFLDLFLKVARFNEVVEEYSGIWSALVCR